MTGGDQIVRANGVDLCFEAFGDRDDPALLLIMGSSAPMDWWDEELCRRLAGGARYVIRYDHRDTGRSTTYESGAPGYAFADLVADAVALLDALGVGPVHLVGMSMGGAIAQLLVLEDPRRVASLTLISTGPGSPGPGDPDLVPMSEEAGARFTTIAEPDWSDREAVVGYVIEFERAAAGSLPFEEARFRAYAERAFDRAVNIESTFTNHGLLENGGRWRDRLGELELPTLVIHGTEDPVVPYRNGLALAKEIPGARLLSLERVGHELPRSVWDLVVPAILEHTAADPPNLVR